MANEIDKAGVAKYGGDRTSADAIKVQGSDLETLDLDRRRVAEWRETRDAGEDVVEAAISGALAEGRAPTKKASALALAAVSCASGLGAPLTGR